MVSKNNLMRYHPSCTGKYYHLDVHMLYCNNFSIMVVNNSAVGPTIVPFYLKWILALIIALIVVVVVADAIVPIDIMICNATYM